MEKLVTSWFLPILTWSIEILHITKPITGDEILTMYDELNAILDAEALKRN